MSERDAVEAVDRPLTVSSLAEDLRDLGVSAGDRVIVHSSLSSLGWVCGDQHAVVEALRSAVTGEGLLVMPTYSTQYSDPVAWQAPPVPDDWVDTIVESRPAYRPAVTPTRGMGAIPECFRCYPDVVRSRHPVYSLAAWGADAETVVADHPYDYPFGEGSPLARLYERDADVLLLGVGHGVNTSLHLAEYRGDFPKDVVENRVPVLEDGRRTFVEYEEYETSTDDFPEVGAAFEESAGIAEGSVGAADAKLIDQPELVDFAADWFGENR